MSRPRFILIFCLLALACTGAPRSSAPDTPEDEVWLTAEAAKAARIVTVQEREIPQSVRVGDKIAFDDLRVNHIFTPVTGRVMRVLAQPGQKVKKGAPLAIIASPDVGSAYSDLVKAESDLLAAESEYIRQIKLLAAQAGAQRDLDMAEANFKRSRAEFERSRQKARLFHSVALDAVSQEYVLRSAIDGEIIARNVNPGMEVQGLYSTGNAIELFTVGDTDEVWVYADIPEVDLPRVRLGAPVKVKVVAYPGRAFEGKVEWISGALDPALRTARIRCALPNRSGELLPEMYASVFIAAAPRRALAIEREAAIPINAQTFTFMAQGPRSDGGLVCKRRRIQVLDTDDAETLEVVGGLKQGERVVIESTAVHRLANDEVWVTPGQLAAAGITTAVATVRDVEDAVSIGGRLAFDDMRVTHVYPPVTGRVTRVLAQPGLKVAKGAPLLTIESPDLGNAFSDVFKAQADFTATEREYQRQKELYEAHAGALKDLEAAENSWRKAKAELDRAQMKKQLLKAGTVDSVTQEYTLRSPIAGEIISRTVNPGMEVQGQYSGAGQAIELFTIGDADKLLVLGDVYEIDLPYVREGEPVTMRLPSYPDRVFRGKAEWVSNVLDPQLRTAKVRCMVDNPDRVLKPEMYEVVTVSVPATQLLAVPRQAVLRRGADTLVFVRAGRADDGRLRFKARKVEVNEERSNGLVPISDGIKPGETVAVEGAVLLLGML